jgi:thermitase
MGNESVVIAIIDSGLDLDHPEFAGKVLPGYDFVNCEGEGGGCTGQYQCDPAEDCNVEDDNLEDFAGHGTLVTGVAGAATNNWLGIAGTCPNCKILPVRACYKGTSGEVYCRLSDINEAIRYAVDNHVMPGIPNNNNVADIISMSFAGEYSGSVENSLLIAYGTGANLVAAAGNYNNNIERYPAAHEFVIGVGATNQNDVRAGFSNYGSWVDVAAPGVDIMTTSIGGYASAEGTSLSAPFVSGLVGLMLSANPSLTQEEIQQKLVTTADSTTGFEPPIGRINAYKALFASTVDIQILNFEQSATHIARNQTLYVEFDIKNDGPVALQGVSVFIDKDYAGNNMMFAIPHMNPGETVYFNMHWSYPTSGTYHPSITADYDNDYIELNETNNVVAFQVVVG